MDLPAQTATDYILATHTTAWDISEMPPADLIRLINAYKGLLDKPLQKPSILIIQKDQAEKMERILGFIRADTGLEIKVEPAIRANVFLFAKLWQIGDGTFIK